MADYMDLVVVDNRRANAKVVCKAPWLSHLKNGDRIVYEIEDRRYEGEVIATSDIRLDRTDDIDFILACTEQKDIGFPKIISKIKVIDFVYEDEEDA